jgi:thiamine pyrophosphate-dependent acetolactate synthase large subunit-like protein
LRVEAAIAEALLAEGVSADRPVFGVMGDGNMGVWAELVGRGGTNGVMRAAWHEAAAVGMADGFSRASGLLGIATVTCGPGLTHAATPLVAAARNRSALLLLAGAIPAGARGTAQALDQQRFIDACGARYRTLSGTATLATDLAAAFREARSGTGPVVLGMGMDLLEQDVAPGWSYAPGEPPLVPPPPTRMAIEATLALLAQARRPVILAGRGAMLAGARDALVALGDRFGALLATTLPAKGFFGGATLDAGIAGGFSCPETLALLAEADVVLAFGATLGDFTTRNGSLFAKASVVQIGLEAPATAPHLRADALDAALALLEAAEAGQRRGAGYRDAETALRRPPQPLATPPDGIEPRRLMRVLGEALPDRARVTCGVGHFWGFVVDELRLPAGGDILFGYDFGAIGQGLPLAIGATIAAPARPHLLIEGDGSLMQHVQELQTAAAAGLNLVVLVMNDGGYGAERHKLAARRFDGALADWPAVDFVRLAVAMGGGGARLEAAEALPALLRQGLDAGGLFVIDARLSPSTMTDAYRRALKPA